MGTKLYHKAENVPIYESNPSVLSTANKLTTKRTKTLFRDGNRALVDASTGELAGHLQRVYIEEVEVDAEKFVKVYASTIDELMHLSGAGLKVFKLVYLEIMDKPNTDSVYLDFNTLKHFKKWQYSQTTFISGINELLTKSILYKAIGPNMFFINIGIFFNGDRVAVIKSYRLKQPNMFEQQDLLSDLT